MQEYQDQTLPIITALCWGIGDSVEVAGTVKDFSLNGGSLIQLELLGPNDSYELWQAELELPDAEMELVRSISSRRIECSGKIYLTSEEHQCLRTSSVDAEGLELSLESLAEMQIYPSEK